MQIRENLTLKSSREKSLSRAPFLDILLRSGSNNFKLGSEPSQSERSRRYLDEQMVPQNNYTLKHNSLTKSSSWRSRQLIAYGKYECAPYYSSKPKANEEWRFENSHCGGREVLTTRSDKVCPSSLFHRKISEKLEPCNSNPEIANAGAPKTTSTPSPSMCASFPASSSVSPWSPTKKAVPELHPNFPCPSLQKHFIQGHMEVNRNGKMSFGRTYNWLSIRLKWSDLLLQDHSFRRHFME